jgi:hypothetical protein
VTIAEVLAPYGVGEDDFVAALTDDLHAGPDSVASQLTVAEDALLREHGGIGTSVGDDAAVGRAVLRSASSNLAQLARGSLSVEQVAKRLLVDGSRVRHRVRDRALYAFKIGGGLRVPQWQFHGHDAIPGLRAVLAALPPELHPLEVAGLMTGPDPGLAVADEALSPRDWLIGGGDVAVVLELIGHLDAW